MTRVAVVQGDITDQDVDAVVNAANEHLAHGGGVAAAIVRAGGIGIQQESDQWVAANGPLSPGVAAVTGAGAMAARWIVHVAGPRYRPGEHNAGLLSTAVHAALEAAATAGARSVALPAISAGIFGYPVDEATEVIADAVDVWCRDHPDVLDEVRLVGWDARTTEAFSKAIGDGR